MKMKMKMKKGSGIGDQGSGAFLGGIARGLFAVAVAAIGLAALAEPKVEITRVDVGNARDGVFAYTYNVSGVTGTCDIDVKITADGGAKTKTDTITRGNGTGSYSVDTKNDDAFGKVYADVTVAMTIAGSGSGDGSELGGVQLWPDGPYWAVCNVGAESPGDSGYYFWWGSTTGYRYVDGQWTDPNGVQTNMFSSTLCPTYKLDNNALSNLGWLNSDGNLKAWCDAATVHLGAPWRMPTSDEIGLLANAEYCKSAWTNLYGTVGMFVTGVKEGYTNKSIFLPAAGLGNGASLINSGSYGYCWSSTPISDNWSVAWYLSFGQSGFIKYCLNERCLGYPVRAVRGFAK